MIITSPFKLHILVADGDPDGLRRTAFQQQQLKPARWVSSEQWAALKVKL
jgi:hypothetical protein